MASGKPRLLFCSYHSYLDPSSGAALSTRDLLEMLAANGWDCAVLSGPLLDSETGGSLEGVLRAQQTPFQYSSTTLNGTSCNLFHCVRNGVSIHGYVPTQGNGPPTQGEGKAFLTLFDTVRERFRPHIVLTFGGQWFMQPLMQRAKDKGCKVVFGLHNFNYRGADLFKSVDAVLLPSQAAKEHYRKTLGLSCTAIPGPWNWKHVLCSEVKGSYVTFINPQPVKGVFWFTRIVHEMNYRRPDIPFLVIEGRGNADWVTRCGLDLTGLSNLHCMPNTTVPRHFYSVSKMVLLPSLWEECFGRVGAESMINGIPVLGSRRGGIVEVLANAGFLFDIPERFTKNHKLLPTAEDVAPWIDTIIRLWDDDAMHRAEMQRCLQAAQIWHPDRLLPRFDEFFRGVMQAQHSLPTHLPQL